MAHCRERRQAAKRLTARSCLQRVTTATRPSITPRSDGLTHAFCQGAEPQRWSLFNLHADTLPLSPYSLFHEYTQAHTLPQTLIKSHKPKCARTQTRTVRMHADTVKHLHGYACTQENTVLPFSANDTSDALYNTILSFYIFCSKIKHTMRMP